MRVTNLAGIAVAGVLAIGAGVWWVTTRRPVVPDPPAPAADRPLDARCARLIEETRGDAVANPRSAAHRVKLAMVYQANGLPALAADTYRQALALDDGHAEWWYHLARAESALGRYDAAIAAMDRAAALDPTHAPIHWNRGFWLLELADLEAAGTAFDRAVETAPREPAGHVGLARIDLVNGAPAAALRRLEPFAEAISDPGYLHQLMGTAYRQLGRADEAAAYLRRAHGDPPRWNEPWNSQVSTYRRSYSASLQDADRLAAAGRDDDAMATLNELRRQRPDDAVLLTKIGELHLSQGRIDEATEALEAALAIDEDALPAHLHLSRLHRTSGNLERALHHARRALEIQPTMGHAHRSKALVDFAAQRWAEAEVGFENAARFGVNDSGTLLNLGLARYEQRKLDAALEAYDGVLQRDPDHFQALLCAAVTNADLRRFSRAVELISAAARLRPDDPALREAARYVQRGSGG